MEAEMGGGVYKPGALRRREGASPAGFRGARLCQPWIQSQPLALRENTRLRL